MNTEEKTSAIRKMCLKCGNKNLLEDEPSSPCVECAVSGRKMCQRCGNRNIFDEEPSDPCIECVDKIKRRVCRKCGNRNIFDEEPSNPCKECVIDKNGKWRGKRRLVLPRINGIRVTRGQYEGILFKQKGCCAGCGIGVGMVRRRFAVDHDHKTGVIRGLLCNPCNFAIGLVYDNPETLRKLADYLDKQKVDSPTF